MLQQLDLYETNCDLLMQVCHYQKINEQFSADQKKGIVSRQIAFQICHRLFATHASVVHFPFVCIHCVAGYDK